MRAALWLLAIFAAAVGLALFATQSDGTVTLFWPPHRIDLSLNLALILLLAFFAAFYIALRAISALLELPKRAKAWRAQQRERAMHSALQGSLGHLLAGRFSRARKLALLCVDYAQALQPDAPQQRETQTLAHLITAEAAQSLQDPALRDAQLKAALATDLPSGAQYLREAVQLRAARWALEDRDAASALSHLAQLPQGAQRRTLALRLKLRASRLGAQQTSALETARLLAKHGGFSSQAAHSLVRTLAIASLSEAHDGEQLQRTWAALHEAERKLPEVATHAAKRLVNLSTANTASDSAERLAHHTTARQWLQPVWQQYPQLTDPQQERAVSALEATLETIDTTWLAQMEEAQRTYPRDARLQYLAGMACMQRSLWGKAQQMLSAAVRDLHSPELERRAWRALAALAEQRGDHEAALAAWKQAALV